MKNNSHSLYRRNISLCSRQGEVVRERIEAMERVTQVRMSDVCCCISLECITLRIGRKAQRIYRL
jgi:hypothetical protein